MLNILDLDNPEHIKSWVFPGGEVGVQLVSEDVYEPTTIHARIRNSDDIMKLLLATNALKARGVKSIELILAYVPYGRQDRINLVGESLSIKVFADLINSQQYAFVHVVDPHSDVTSALIDNVVVTKPNEFISSFLKSEDIKPDDFVYVVPDRGALKKAHDIAKGIGYKKDFVIFDKVRDFATGEILDIESDYHNYKNKNFIIIDDICDGGRTFIEIAKKLKEGRASKVSLFVTHGIFSKGLEPLKEYIDTIYTTNSFTTFKSDDYLKVADLHITNCNESEGEN